MSEYSKHSIKRLETLLYESDVPYWAIDTISNYLLYGFMPGGFLESFLANDLQSAISHSHTSNSMQCLKSINYFTLNHLVQGLHYGSYEVVKNWSKSDSKFRRTSLEQCGLVYPKNIEVIMELQE